MNKHMDIKRTVLWVVFSMSMLLLWDNWLRYTGKPSMFFPTATQQAKPASGRRLPNRSDNKPAASVAKLCERLKTATSTPAVAGLSP